ncbi:sensor histidine kinase [Microbacterium tumbae]
MRTPFGAAAPPAGVQPRAPWWLSDVLLTVVIVAAPFAPSPVREFAPTGTAGWVLSLIPIVVLPWRRRWPIAVLLALLAVFAAAAFTGTLSPGAGLAVSAAMFQVTVRGPRRRALIVAACVVPGIVLLSLPAVWGSVFDPRVLQFGLVVAFAAAAGDGLRSRREYVLAIMERAERAEQTREAEARRRVTEERLKIARDLHDTVAHQIAVINLNAGVASSAIDIRPEKVEQALATIRAAGRAVLGEIGDLLAMLRSDDDPDTAPQPGVDRLDDLLAQFRTVGMEATLRTEGDLVAVDGAPGRVVYRVVQEALTNAHKHGAEHRAHVLIVVAEEVTVIITNPVGDQPERDAGPPSGFGLTGLRERIAVVRGSLEAGSTPGGWKLTARIPLAKEASR